MSLSGSSPGANLRLEEAQGRDSLARTIWLTRRKPRPAGEGAPERLPRRAASSEERHSSSTSKRSWPSTSKKAIPSEQTLKLSKSSASAALKLVERNST
jgi:hypothetical protein